MPHCSPLKFSNLKKKSIISFGLFASLVGIWALFTCLIDSFPVYQLQIPNGHQIPHPCDRSTFWQGVGHENSSGTGPRNPFGLDFAAAGHKWTISLCRKDSDEDGKTNGEELGDPDCTWNMVSRPAITDPAKLSHPGVCEPVTSPHCRKKNYFLVKNALCRQLLGEEISRPEREVADTKLLQEKTQISEGERVKSETTPTTTMVPSLLFAHKKVENERLEQSSTTLPAIETLATMKPSSSKIPSEVVIYEGPLEEFVGEDEEKEEMLEQQQQRQQKLAGPKPHGYQTIAMTTENFTQFIQVPLPSFNLVDGDRLDREEIVIKEESAEDVNQSSMTVTEEQQAVMPPIEEPEELWMMEEAPGGEMQQAEEPFFKGEEEEEEQFSQQQLGQPQPISYQTVSLTTEDVTEQIRIPLFGFEKPFNEIEAENQIQSSVTEPTPEEIDLGDVTEQAPSFSVPEVTLPQLQMPEGYKKMEVYKMPTVFRTVTEANTGQPLFRYRYLPSDVPVPPSSQQYQEILRAPSPAETGFYQPPRIAPYQWVTPARRSSGGKKIMELAVITATCSLILSSTALVMLTKN